jgi:hypothetical protein
MKIAETVKTVGGVIIPLGVTGIVGGIVKSNVDTEDSGFIKKSCIAVGALVLGLMLGEAASNYFDGKVDEAAEAVKPKIEVEEKPEEKKD